MVNLLVTLLKIVFFYYMIDLLRLFQKRSFGLSSEHENQNIATLIDLLRLFQKRSFVLSSEHENQNIATIGTVLDQFMLSCK